MKGQAQRQLDELLDELEQEQKVPDLLLHSCCGPCSTYVIEYLSCFFRITVFYYNPNIDPEDEYRFRAKEQKRFIESFPTKYPVRFVEGEYEPARYYETVSGLEDEPEGGRRCEQCFRLRLTKTAQKAAQLGADYFATTLTISPQKNVELLNRLGNEIGDAYNVTYLPSEFRKKNGYLRSTQLSAEYHMYRQDFCGCKFSIR